MENGSMSAIHEIKPLHTKYRPDSLDSFIGNGTVKSSLQSILGKPHCPRTFLLHGSPGLGKTTLARIIAKGFGCEPAEVKEINMAIDRGIGAAREIRGEQVYLPLHGNDRVYILDEAQATTMEFQQSMLKILEEPEHAVFILCTTEPEKLIDTVWARCMRLELKPLTDDQIRQLLRDVLDKEGKKGFPKQATTIITERAKGCPREALMLLGQVIGMDGEEALAFLGAEPGVAQRPDTAPEQPLTLAEALFSPTKKLLMPWNDFNELDIPKREFIIRPWLKEGDIVLITGVPGVGKTYFALEIARTASQGEKGMDGLWDASEIVTPTLFVDGELPQSDLQERGELTGLAKGDNCTLLSKLRLESADVDFDLAEGQHRGLLTELIMRGNDRGPYKLVILDNLFSLFNLNMKDDISWGAVNSWMLRLRAKGVTVVLLHHPTKKKKEQFGTAVRTFNISTHLHLEAPENYAGENARFTINIHKKRDKGLNVAGKQFEFVDGDWIVGFAGGGEEIKMMVARALIEGKSQADIAKEIGKSKGRISQIKKQLLDEGLIKEKAEGGYESTAQEEELEEGDDLEQE